MMGVGQVFQHSRPLIICVALSIQFIDQWSNRDKGLYAAALMLYIHFILLPIPKKA